jgi:hypothetical protein
MLQKTDPSVHSVPIKLHVFNQLRTEKAYRAEIVRHIHLLIC